MREDRIESERPGVLYGRVNGFSCRFRTADSLIVLIILAGVGFRLAEYANHRPLWMDEKALRENVVNRPVFQFDRPLVRDQLAPPGFLAVARVSARLIGGSDRALRLLPLIGSIAALFAIWPVARRTVSREAVPIALAIVAVSDDLIYYASEFKQYSSDTLIAVGVLLLGLDLDTGAWTARRLVRAAVLGAAATWFSHPSVFVLAGVGVGLAIRAAIARNGRRLLALTGIGTLWGISFLANYVVSSRMLGGSRWMWTWWNFAFLPLPPRSLVQAEQVFWQVANVFTDPVGLTGPFGLIFAALVALGLFLLGCFDMATRKKGFALLVLVAPIGFALLASTLRLYPFHGRLLLFLVPSLVLPLAEGVAAVGRRAGRVAMAIVLVLLLIGPVLHDLDRIDQPRFRTFDSHGDQRNDLLDDLEQKGWWPTR